MKISAEALAEDFEERAGIMEFDGGLSRREAEAKALEIVSRGNRPTTPQKEAEFTPVEVVAKT
jgi:hypothetical protein